MDEKKVLIIGHTWPEPTATAAGERMMQLIYYFKAKKCNIIFGCTAKKNKHSVALDPMGIRSVFLELNSDNFDAFIKEFSPDIVVFDRFITEEQFGWRVSEYAAAALKILDTEDLHSLRDCRKKAIENKAAFDFNKWRNYDLTKREIASIYRCDLSLIISQFEMQLLQEELKIPGSQLLYLPYFLKPINEAQHKNWCPFEERDHFMFVGNGKHQPNIDAVKWLKAEIWPEIRKALPAAELHVYGAYLPKNILDLDDQKTGFRIMGWAEDMVEILDGIRVNLVPLRYGAGIKGKLVKAIFNGVPSITTHIGVEGISNYPHIEKEHPDMSAAFVAQAILAYKNKIHWKALQHTGRMAINTQFDLSVHYLRFSKSIKDTIDNLDRHRANNFVGAMLLHHTMAGSKYMAKWIAAKNALALD